jgi:transposase
MPKLCHARAPSDLAEAARIRKLAQSHHAPHDCKQRAQMIALSWEGLRTAEIACHLRCHPQRVRERFERFRTEGLDGLTNRPGAGRKARLTELERSQLIALVAQAPPGRPVRQADGQLVADHPTQPTQWSLDALVSAAHQAGIAIKRSQVRRILLKEGVHWRQVRSWAVSNDPNFVPKGPQSSKPTPGLKPARRPCA